MKLYIYIYLKKLHTCSRQSRWVKVQPTVCPCIKLFYSTANTHKWSCLPWKLASHSGSHIPSFIFSCVKCVALNHLKQVLPSLCWPWRHLTPIPGNPLPQCSICILIAIQQSSPAAPGDSARPVKAQLARKWASHAFRVHRPWDGSFAGSKHSELNLPPGALWTPWRHCRYYHCAWQVRDAFALSVNILYKYLLLLNSFYVNWAMESNSTPHIIII